MSTTTNLADFGHIERQEASELLAAYGTDKDKTIYFYSDDVHVMFNQMSGYVFLTNSDFQVAMLDDGLLVDFLTCPNCGNEGLLTEKDDWATDDCCKQYLKDLD